MKKTDLEFMLYTIDFFINEIEERKVYGFDEVLSPLIEKAEILKLKLRLKIKYYEKLNSLKNSKNEQTNN